MKLQLLQVYIKKYLEFSTEGIKYDTIKESFIL